jgi:hypothetical protein
MPRFNDWIRAKSQAPSISGKVIPLIDDTSGTVFKKDADGVGSAAGSNTVQTLSYAANITMNVVNGKWAKLTLTGNVSSLTIINMAAGDEGVIIVTQGGTGLYSIGWGAAILPPAGMPLNEGVTAVTVIEWKYDGVRMLLTTPSNSSATKKLNLNLASVDGSQLIPAGTLVQAIVVKPASDLTAFKIGTTNGGEEILSAQGVSSSGWVTINVQQYFSNATSLYFGGITSLTDIFIFYA